MDMSNKSPTLAFFIHLITCVSGLDVPQLDKLWVNILDGEVIALWKPPAGVPSNTQYNVQMEKYAAGWAEVVSCSGITNTYCDLSSLIDDYSSAYKVRVQVVSDGDVSEWKAKKFLPNKSELQPPSFTLWATSSTITVYVHQKPILRKLFPYGVTYTVNLTERGKHDKITVAYLKDDELDEERTKTFRSLRWGVEYCISINVEGNGALSRSSVTPEKCLLLPEQEWYMIAVSSLSTLGVFAVIAIMAGLLMCFLNRPEKMPAALKSPVHGWHPLTVGKETLEVVTDRGWFLSSYRTETSNCIAKDQMTRHVTETEEDEEEDRRTSMDSGVSIDSNSATKSGESPPMRHEDSGCESMGAPESSTSSQTDYPLQDDGTDPDTVGKKEDSGVRLSGQLDSCSMNLDGKDSEPLREFVAGSDYRCQRSSSVQIRICNDDEAFKHINPNSVLAEMLAGYRAGPQSCICSGAGQCTWCHKQGLHATEATKQYRPLGVGNGQLSSKCNLWDSYKEEHLFSSYPQKTEMDQAMMSCLDTSFIQLGESFPLLAALSPGKVFNMNNVSLSLCDVLLETD